MHADRINDILILFNEDINSINNIFELNNVNSKYLGKTGIINIFFLKLQLEKLSEKKIYLKILNDIKKKIIETISTKKYFFLNKKSNYKIDLNKPSTKDSIGHTHIINKIITDIKYFFLLNKFNIENGKEIDNIYYNFDALNMPKKHPSRNLSDTFYINKNIVLRTHTSNMQIHLLEKKIPPLKILSYGKVYRKDYDVSHTPMFHQIEGFVVDTKISLSSLKTILNEFLKYFFNTNITIKFRSSYFPFTEPSFEVDIKCVSCLGYGCNICKHTGWIEILGCGMINPTILNNCNINSIVYKGFAFGMGVERLAMIKYKINDIKLFYENNLDFLSQF